MEVRQVEITSHLNEFEEKFERTLKKRKREEDDGNTSESSHVSVHSTNEMTSRAPKQAVVVLNKLPTCKISALRPPTPEQFYSEAESQSSSDSDLHQEPGENSSDSDVSHTKTRQKSKKCAKTSSTNNNSELDPAPVIITSSLATYSNEITRTSAEVPQQEISMDMTVLARKKCMRWQRGKIVEIIRREDGRLKYKVCFEEKGKSLVSGHHVAFDTTPKLEQLFIGARMVVRCQVNKFRFLPGILAELPSRNNRLRFLVFIDDHTPVYVGLPLIHLICRPLENPLDDLPDTPHKSFMAQYLKDWPYPHLTQYRPGQNLSVELNGKQHPCEVVQVDCSLIQVSFQHNQQKEWIHRGSTRLEHMARFLEMKAME
ncbi:histone-lysine N-methyltransferase SETDB1-B-like isoform X2 [Sphaeramia orbicularis]|uniref:histone-lysine N-methyltransferase SETDB1-B-like isoform X2 n=1 Tax=Sphaeramia orbicularis TaxID=375764 RepID=UPI00117E2108|nr:histone-lysine N-methyltransferase SETDB1-B-like isoform X2 [Sphaeramia orbicularis]XP_030003011.1 histone-lysine N-methyltransferase SETDB1-B-like isoform X2 [Sphaeramia orbicularis]